MSEKLLFTDSSELRVIDLSALPFKEKILKTRDYKEVMNWIADGRIKGPSMIASVALYGIAMALDRYESKNKKNTEIKISSLAEGFRKLDALNSILNYSLNLLDVYIDRMHDEENEDFSETAVRCADEFFDEDCELNNNIAVNGLSLFTDNMNILTAGNWGNYSSCGVGTAHGLICKAFSTYSDLYVYICETRPSFSGSKLASFDFEQSGIDFEIIPDTNSAALINGSLVDCVIAGTYYIASNGDMLCDPGTLNLALLCRQFNIPFYIAAQSTALDYNSNGLIDFKVPENDPSDLFMFKEINITKDSYNFYNPAFDIIDGELISAIITEYKVHFPPYDFSALKHLLRSYINLTH